MLDRHEREARRCLDAGLVIPAYEATLVCSHQFNILDARGAVSATDRVGIDPADSRSRLRLRAGLRFGQGRTAVSGSPSRSRRLFERSSAPTVAESIRRPDQ